MEKAIGETTPAPKPSMTGRSKGGRVATDREKQCRGSRMG